MVHERKSVTDSVIDAWVASNRGMKCWPELQECEPELQECEPALQVCRGMQMQYRLSKKEEEEKWVTCVVENVGPLMEDGRPSGVTISFVDEDGIRREKNTVLGRLV
jgi:hypothetical protein